MKFSSFRWCRSWLSAVTCLSIVLLGVAEKAQAGPLLSANVHIYDGVTLVDNSTLVITTGGTGGMADPWTILLQSTSTSKLVGGGALNYEFKALFGGVFGGSNQPGDPWGAMIQSSEVNVKQTTGGVHDFTVELTDVGFSSPVGTPLLLISSGSVTYNVTTKVGPVTDSSSLQSFADPGNGKFVKGIFTPGVQTSTSTGVNGNSASFLPDSKTVLFPRVGDFSLTSVYSLHTVGVGHQASANTITTAVRTPEPASMALFGMGAFGMAGYGWRRRKTGIPPQAWLSS